MEPHHLSEEDKYKVTLQVDHFIELLSARYGIEPNEVIDAVKWVRERKKFTDSIQNASTIAFIGAMVSAILFALWQGIIHFVQGNKS
jgi:hypothetical protein